MRINGEVTIVEIDSADVEPFPLSHKPLSNSSSQTSNTKDANFVMQTARQSLMTTNVPNIPDNHTGTWSGQGGASRRTTVMKVQSKLKVTEYFKGRFSSKNSVTLSSYLKKT